MSDTTERKPILAMKRVYRTARGARKGEVRYYHDGQCAMDRTESVVPFLIENAPPYDPQSGDWTNLLRWYYRTRDLPGAREAYEQDEATVRDAAMAAVVTP